MAWAHTGSSANINYYVEDERQPFGTLWAEVLTNSLEKQNGKWRRRSPALYHLWVYRQGQGELAGFDYEPASDLGEVLPPRTVAKLVNDFMKTSGISEETA